MRDSGSRGRGGRHHAARPGGVLTRAGLAFALALAGGAAVPPAQAAATAEAEAEAVAACVDCHGTASGEPVTPETPALAGLTELYALYQLVYFRSGQRKNEIMSELVREMSDDDLRALAAWVGSLPLPEPRGGPVDRALHDRGAALVRSHGCGSCHEPDLSGREHLPRLAGQQEAYLLAALRDYKAGRRVGLQAAMAEVLSPMTDDDLVAMAHFMANAGR